MNTTKELIDLINLKQTDEHTYEGYSITVGSANVFGGQVLAQALNAAYKTVPEGRLCHSMHAYFILPGDLEKPISFKVQQVRDGGSFTTRYVTAKQDDAYIFVLACSFQKHEEGLEYQTEMPEDIPEPETLMSWKTISEHAKGFITERIRKFLSIERPIIIKPTVIQNPFDREDLPPIQNIWFKFKEIDNDITIKNFQEIIAYTSDYNILLTALQPHASEVKFSDMQIASLDHAMWFHRIPDDYTDWFLYHISADSNSNARGLTIGKIFDRKGLLIATVSQEGLIRKIKK